MRVDIRNTREPQALFHQTQNDLQFGLDSRAVHHDLGAEIAVLVGFAPTGLAHGTRAVGRKAQVKACVCDAVDVHGLEWSIRRQRRLGDHDIVEVVEEQSSRRGR
jgi:hypothetical protein